MPSATTLQAIAILLFMDKFSSGRVVSILLDNKSTQVEF